MPQPSEFRPVFEHSPGTPGQAVTYRFGLVAFALLCVVVIISLLALRAPNPVPSSAPLDSFSSARALAHVRAISQVPRPIGSADHTVARAYILQQLVAINVVSDVQQTVVADSRGRLPYAAGTVHNILARLPGTANTAAIVLVAHYDSVLSGPGASDNGASVASLVETLRALKAGPALRNDVIAVFTDGEEVGLLGAQAFVAEHPWGKSVGLVLNFEARGTSGPSLLFETSPHAGWLVQEFAKAAPYPFASSLFASVYTYLPNDTDFTIFKAASIPGLNFAFIDGYTAYHSANDNIAHVDEASLQHHGSYALALARHFGVLDLHTPVNSGDAVYFDLFGRVLVHYPTWLVLPLLGLVIVAFIGVVVLGIRRRFLSGRGIMWSFVAFVPHMVVGVLLAIPLQFLAAALHEEYLYYGTTYNHLLYLASLLLLIVAVSALLQRWLWQKYAIQNVAIGALLWWLILAALTSIVVPGASYLFVWPLLFALVGQAISFAPQFNATARMIAPLVGVVPGVVLFTPLIYLLFVALGLRLGTIVGLVAVLVLGLLVPYMRIISPARRWLFPGVATLAAIVLLVVDGLMARPSPEHPRFDNVLYGLNADTGSAVWASIAPRPDAWSAQYVGTTIGSIDAFFPLIPAKLPRADAPVVALAAPQVALVNDATVGNVRTVQLHISSPRQAPLMWVYADPQTSVLNAAINGKPLQTLPPAAASTATPSWAMIYWALPPEGIDITLSVPANQLVKLRLVDRTDGLPAVGGPFKLRDATMIASPALGLPQYSNATLVSKSFSF